MEFIDHGHWILSPNGCCHLALVGVQGHVQALQQVLKIKHRLLQLCLLVGQPNLHRGMRS